MPQRAMRELRICLFGDGASVHVRRWAADLAARGCQVAIVSVGPAEQLDGVIVHTVPSVPPLVRQVVARRSARRFLREFRPDIVHVHYLSPGPRTLWPLGFGRLVISTYGSDIEAIPGGVRGWAARRILSAVMGHASALVTASNYLMEQTQALGITKHSVIQKVIGFGVDCDRFLPSQATNGREMVIGYAKGLRDYYGPLDLIEAVARARSRGYPIRLRIAGDGPLAEAVSDAVALGGLESAVDLLGQLDETRLPAFFAEIDLLAMPSHREAYGVAALEAAASGKPVVATRVGGIPEIVADGVSGLLVPPRDPAALTEAITQLADNAELRNRMGAAGRRLACERHSRKSAVDAMLDLYEMVVSHDQKRGGSTSQST